MTEQNSFLEMTKNKEDTDSDIYMKNSELLGLQVNLKKNENRFEKYQKGHADLVKKYGDDAQTLKNKASSANQELNAL